MVMSSMCRRFGNVYLIYMKENNLIIKWILINNEIRISSALYHRWLLKKNEYTCDGGGIVTIDKENKLIIFSGESDDFGKASEKEFWNAVEHCREDIDFCIYTYFDECTENYIINFC